MPWLQALARSALVIDPSGWVASFSRFVSGDGRQRCSRCCSEPLALALGPRRPWSIRPLGPTVVASRPRCPAGRRGVSPRRCAPPRRAKRASGSTVFERQRPARGTGLRVRRTFVRRSRPASCRPVANFEENEIGVLTLRAGITLLNRNEADCPRPETSNKDPAKPINSTNGIAPNNGHDLSQRCCRPSPHRALDTAQAPQSAPDRSIPRANKASCVGIFGTSTRSGSAHFSRSITSASRRFASGSSQRLRCSSGSSTKS